MISNDILEAAQARIKQSDVLAARRHRGYVRWCMKDRKPITMGDDRSLQTRQIQARRVARALKRLYPDATCALRHSSAFELLVATILSAQCTDKKVNEVTPALFARWSNAQALAAATQGELEQLIRPTGFFRSKSKSLKGMAQALVEDHDGEVPRALDKLTALPGVGRKTAHVVLGTWFRIASGVVVDTHVTRLSYRMGLTEATDPGKIERDLMQVLPRKQWIDFSHRMIEHGRSVCVAQRPRCLACGLRKVCPKNGVTMTDLRTTLADAAAETGGKSAP